MAGKTVKMDSKLYNEIVKLLKKPAYRYKHPSIASFINEAVYKKLSEEKTKKLFKLEM